ncbi:MAG: hypothetical protein J7605_02730 [Variovorax sp.]|nr:hypothetical protein [Variovorax sp.]
MNQIDGATVAHPSANAGSLQPRSLSASSAPKAANAATVGTDPSATWKRCRDAGRTPERIAAHVATVPAMYRGREQRAIEGKVPPRVAIKVFCLACTGHIRADVARCSSWTCALWTLRPFQQVGEAGAADDLEVDSDHQADGVQS